MTTVKHTYDSILLHIVFATSERRPMIPRNVLPELHAYIGGVAKNIEAVPVIVGGVEDHVHALVRIAPSQTPSDVVGKLKANSSRWMREHIDSRFGWQRGYGAFSVSRSNEAIVARYIARQAEHHALRSFLDEWAALLARHGLS